MLPAKSCSLRIHVVVLTPIPQNATASGNKIVTEVIKLNGGGRGPCVLIQSDSCAYKKRKFKHTERDIKDACAQRKDQRRHSKKVAIFKPRRERGPRRHQTC